MPACGHTAKENRPTQETFHCVGRGHQAHADTVGALNVLQVGLVRREAQPAWREATSSTGWRSHPYDQGTFAPHRGTARRTPGCPTRCPPLCGERASLPYAQRASNPRGGGPVVVGSALGGAAPPTSRRGWRPVTARCPPASRTRTGSSR
uniref:zinc ribbon domain-containing protein n=1 Tax=Streptomyces albospinus TaxID=285515 RepID=UPI003570A894